MTYIGQILHPSDKRLKGMLETGLFMKENDPKINNWVFMLCSDKVVRAFYQKSHQIVVKGVTNYAKRIH